MSASLHNLFAHGAALLFAQHGEALPVHIADDLRDQLGDGEEFTCASFPGCRFVAVYGEVEYSERQLEILRAEAERQRGLGDQE